MWLVWRIILNRKGDDTKHGTWNTVFYISSTSQRGGRSGKGISLNVIPKLLLKGTNISSQVIIAKENLKHLNQANSDYEMKREFGVIVKLYVCFRKFYFVAKI